MIGIFDSGSGGLSVLRAIRAQLPMIDVLYLGDIKNMPYGEKSQKKLSELTAHSLQFFQSHKITNIVSACNSVSASLVTELFDTLNMSSDRLIEMVGPTVSSFQKSTERILLCATPATIHSGIYQNGFRMLGKEIATVAIPELAGAIEFDSSEKEIEQIIIRVFAEVQPETFDTLVLGCTHYPLVAHIFTKVLGSSVRVVDPAQCVAQRVAERFSSQKEGTGILHFVLTQDSTVFRNRVAKLFSQSTVEVEVLK